MSDQIRAITAALEFIDGHLQEPITVADIAAAAGYSLYHFIRTFNQTVQHTPYDYLMRRRLSEAARSLLQSKRRVIDIAFDFQFSNHETFTRAFGRVFGMSPTHWREAGLADPRLLLPGFDRDYLDYLNTPDFVPPKLAALDEMVLSGLMAPLSADPEVISTLWRNLEGILAGLPVNFGPRDFWGIRIQPQISERNSYYLAALKIPTLESAPSTFVTKIVPAGDYLCLTQKNMAADLEPALTYLYHTFLPKSGLQFMDPLEIEHFGDVREIFIPVKVLQKQSSSLSKKQRRSEQRR
jgi:AraC family transcriptional regulator